MRTFYDAASAGLYSLGLTEIDLGYGNPLKACLRFDEKSGDLGSGIALIMCPSLKQKVNGTHWTYNEWFDRKKIDSNFVNLLNLLKTN